MPNALEIARALCEPTIIDRARVLFLANYHEMASEAFGREFGDIPLPGLNDRPLTAVDTEIDSPSRSPPMDTRTQATRRVAGRSFPLDHVSRAVAADAFATTNLEQQQGDQPPQETEGTLPAADSAPHDPPSLPPTPPMNRGGNPDLNL